MLFPRDRTRLGFVASPAAEPPEEEVPIAPILTLLPASDLGSTSGDHLSNDPFPQMAADFDDAAQAGETVRIYLDAGDTAGATLHDSFVLTSEMLSGGTVPPGTFDAIPPGAWLITMTHVNAGGESPHSNAVPYTMNQSLGPVVLSVGVSDQTSDTTPDCVLDLSGADVLAGDHAAVIAADGTVLGTADLTTATLASCPVTLSTLALGAHTVRGYVWRDDGSFTELQSYTFTINAALAISGTPVLTATEDTAYAGFTASATGGVPAYTFSLEGTWPAGISIDSGTGVVSGTPTESGTFADLFVRVTDDEGSTDDLATFTLEVEAAGYAADAAVFDGANDYMLRSPTGIADGKKGILSIWAHSQNAAAQYFFSNAFGRYTISIDSTTGKLRIVFKNGANTTILSALSNSGFTNAGGWQHALVSWDLAAAAFHLYFDDTDDAVTPSTFTDDTIDYTAGEVCFGANRNSVFAAKLNSYIADVYFNTAEYLDFSVEANRRKFIDAAGKPADLGAAGSTPTGNQPAYFFKGAAAGFDNVGSGGSFTLTGALTDAPTSPSD